MASLSRFSPRALVVLGVVIAAAVALHAQQRPSFRSTIDLVMLNVTVTGAAGRYVADLSADDFQVLEEGRSQELAFFSPANAPLSVSLVLDTSGSMDEQMPQAKQAAMEFIARLRPGDVAEIITFDNRVEVLQPLTSDRSLLEAAIQRMRAGGSTALYNAVYIVLRQLAKVKPQPGDEIRRQVIVVLSDGEDTSSLVTFEHLLDSARRSQTAIYTIGLGLDDSKRTRSDGEFALRQLSQETGAAFSCPSGQRISPMCTAKSRMNSPANTCLATSRTSEGRVAAGVESRFAFVARTCKRAHARATTQQRPRPCFRRKASLSQA